jgi:aspartate/methionine/tyrosine aminotransferase
MLSSSDAESRTIGDVLALEPGAHEELLGQSCGYTETEGAPPLRAAIAALYERAEPDDVLVTTSAEEAIFLLHTALLERGDHAIIGTPCYESALQVARATGADVDEWRRSFADGWRHDFDALERLLRPATRLLYVNQPHNPTGTLMTRAELVQTVEIAREAGAVLVSDEVYRELEHGAERLPAACDLFERAVSIGSISKTYGLPGLRTGWIVTRDAELRRAVHALKHYTTICVSAPSELLTAVALRHRGALVERNLGLIRRNLPLLDDFLARRDELFTWVRPTASPIGFPRLEVDDVDEFCHALAREGVLLLPGSVYDEPRHVRVGFGRANMPEALQRLDALLDAGVLPVRAAVGAA